MDEIANSSIDVENIEKQLCQIEEIKAARIVTGHDSKINEVHILAHPSKGPKQLVRDIESLLLAQYGITVDHKIISIAQVNENNHHPSTQTRPIINSINVEDNGIKSTVMVTITIEDDIYIGESDGPASKTGRQRIIAIATLNAIEKFMKGSSGFALEDVDVVSLGKQRVAISCITHIGPNGESQFSGSALVKKSENDAIVKATLNAINRRFGFLKT